MKSEGDNIWEKDSISKLISIADVELVKYFYIRLYLQATLQFLETNLYFIGFGTKVEP